MRMWVCYLDCHEAGLCCYLAIQIENLLRPLPPFVTYLLTLPRIFSAEVKSAFSYTATLPYALTA
jgi:hypothetical protein